ncbi:MFS transporter [Thiorhodovibrio frisius]|uniref:Nitrate/nitrite transporter n=1 Tax=Thiorhodovibrio frisius TaxID=631362 RepID=H8Z6T2_9GAMM|nr:MFS transporter [Thiorhodovibrio frisius]EIC20798.1 nitrate/nitrite transporter [Thiorhodovibrio frisius]WPL21849.1 Major Facilitator Superfamily protein [Thiorhodovibrio frisius]
MRHANALDSLYDLVTGDEDARVCKDIPAASCNDQPRNFFAYLLANLLTKVADELASAKLLLPWLFGALGAPALLVGFLVPIREAGVLLPQLAVAAVIRQRPLRKPVWILGALLSAVALALMAVTAGSLRGAAAGWVMLSLLVLFSLSRGLCSVSAKDVLGKTVSKSRRGRLMGLSAGIAGVMTLGVGFYLEFLAPSDAGIGVFVALLAGAAVFFVLSALVFQGILEQPGATSGGGNALQTAIESIGLLKTDPLFLRFVLVRIALLSVALTAPFYVLLAQQHSDGALTGLGLLIIASGLASSISAPLWGWLSDRSARWVMVLAAGMAGALGLVTWLLAHSEAAFWLGNPLAFAGIFLLLGIAHAGVRIGRKVYLVDMASAEQRAAMVAVSNTVIGVAMLLAGPVGLLGDSYGPALVVLVLGVGALVAAGLALGLREVSEPDGG